MAILIFENNAILANAIKQNLIAEGHNALIVREPNEVPGEKEFWRDIELVILDLMMGDIDLPVEWRRKTENGLITGYVVFKNMCPYKNIPVLVLTGLQDKKLLDEVKKGINNCLLLEKPTNHDELLDAVKQLLKT